MPTRVLVVGGGGREHALAWKLSREPGVNRIVVAPGSDGIATEPRVAVVDVPAEAEPLVALARAESVELVVIGPEAPLAAGLADDLRAAGIATFGPSKAAARIETSKAFCHAVAEAAAVPMAKARSFTDVAPAVEFGRSLARPRNSRGVVVKADGLAAGKGVTVCDPGDPLDEPIRRALAEPGGRVVVEERLEGREASLIAVCDGRDALALPPARDHKRLLDGDEGPNTGGMGAFSPVPDLSDDEAAELVDRFHRPILAELARRGSPFVGALYAGLMLTPDGPRLLECNARCGDPETQVLLPRLGVALGPLLLAAARGRLAHAARPLGLTSPLLPATRSAAVGVVLAAGEYPGGRSAGARIVGLERAGEVDALVFHAGTRRSADGGWQTDGGRVLTVVGRGPDLEAARGAAYRAADRIRFEGVHARRDIGAAAGALAGAGAPT
jgi:phosphoribosylamine--glycine ligase